MLNKFIFISLFMSACFSLNALQFSDLLENDLNINTNGNYSDSTINKCKILFKLLDEEENPERIQVLKIQLLVELKYLEFRYYPDNLTEEENADPTAFPTYKAIRQEIKDLQSYCY